MGMGIRVRRLIWGVILCMDSRGVRGRGNMEVNSNSMEEDSREGGGEVMLRVGDENFFG